MASSEDFKRIRSLYQTDGVPRGITIERFCQENGIVYSHYARWLKKQETVEICPVRLVDSESDTDQIPNEPIPDRTLDNKGYRLPVRRNRYREENEPIFSIAIRTKHGLLIQHDNITYPQLSALVSNLKTLLC